MRLEAISSKERLGRITLEYFKQSVRLRWTVNYKTYSLTIGKVTDATLRIARAKARAIDSDITLNQFDSTLAKYGKLPAAKNLKLVESPVPELRPLWDKFLDNKLPHLKAKSQEEYYKFSLLLDKIDGDLSFDALHTKTALLKITTIDQTRRLLQYLSACCNWGIKHRLISDNPFLGVSAEMPKRKSIANPQPNAFTEVEREAVINAFKCDRRSGTSYSHYAAIVEFWFFTGCRPSEAIGLTWNKISFDCTQVTFNGSIQTLADGSQVWSSGSKNNKSRAIALSNRATELLRAIAPKNYLPTALIFPSPTGKPINYNNFTKRAWNAIVDPIKPDTTPYNCRDTFITCQLLKGIPSAIIAKWCDTSTLMIDRVYADKLKLGQCKPQD